MDYLGLDAKKMALVADQLNKLLANYNVYYQNLRSFHWHVSGRSFFDLHNLFEDYYNKAKNRIDDVAERILTIGYRPDGDLLQYIDKSKIDESRNLLSDDEMARHVLVNQKELIALMRSSIKTASSVEDEGTVDLISGMLSEMEKDAWLLHSWAKRSQIGFLKSVN